MCCDQLWNLTGNLTMASSPAACIVPSINALEHNYISVRAHTPRKRQSEAIHFYIPNSGGQSPV